MSRLANQEEARRWFTQAGYDAKAARWNLKGGFFNTTCFLAQQAAEKALKSLLHYQGISRKKMLSHSVVELLSSLEEALPAARALGEEGRELDIHYIPSRYPNGLPGGYPHAFYSEATGRSAIDAAEKIIDAVKDCYRQHGFEHTIAEKRE